MAKHLFNYCAIDWYENELKANNLDLHQMVKDMGVDGIEQFIYSLEPVSNKYKDITVGVHFNYWPYFLGGILCSQRCMY